MAERYRSLQNQHTTRQKNAYASCSNAASMRWCPSYILQASCQRDKADFADMLPDKYTAAFDADFTSKLGLMG